MAISAVIIAKNEEKVLPACLKSICWADEIVVLDSGSTDGTRAICQDAGAPWASKIRYQDRAWTGFKDQRNASLALATHDWVFVIDADEVCSPALAEKLRALVASDSVKPAYFKVRRKEYYLGKEIRYGIWNPSYQDRFFHKRGVQYVNEVHEYPAFPAPATRIHEPIEHAQDLSARKILDKMNRYTDIEARDRFQQGFRTNIFRIVMAFPAMFLKNYFYYKAYRDGVHGLVISCLEGISRVVRHVKIWEIQTRK